MCETILFSSSNFDKISTKKVVCSLGEVGMSIEIYLDTLFFMNLIINLWILKLLKIRFALDTKSYKLWLSACFGAVVYICQFFLPAYIPIGGILLQILGMGLSVPGMSVLILTKRKRHLWKKVILQGLAYSFMIGGILRAVLVKWKLFAGQEITLFTVLVGVYVCVQTGSYIVRKGRLPGKKSICQAIITSSGTKTKVKALLDTGNNLLEPISQKPVCLAEEELLARITLENPLFYRAIPFSSVGCQQGILYGVEIPELTIINGEQCYKVSNVICAGVSQKLSHKNAYQMILHPALCTEESGER